MSKKSIDLNSDLGEGTGNDAAIMRCISSANIACGGHAGDENTIQQAIELALQNGVAIGAHPGFVDKENFGRKELYLPAQELADQISDQLEQFEQIARRAGTQTQYVKLHGALANMAAADRKIADVALGAIRAFRDNMPVLALAKSQQIKAAAGLGLPYVNEFFADRAYTRHGQLVSRAIDGSVLEQKAQVLKQVMTMVNTGTVISISGEKIQLSVQSICLHGDNAHAVALGNSITKAITENGIQIKTFATNN